MTKLDEAKITRQGQVSIPKKVRDRLGLHLGARVAFLEDEKGRIYIEEVEAPIEFTHKEWEQFLAKTRREPVTRVKGQAAALMHLDKLSKK